MTWDEIRKNAGLGAPAPMTVISHVPLSCGRKGMPAIVIETIFQGRMMVARTPDGTVARAERTNTGPGTGTYEITLANGRVIGKGYAALPARLHLAWAGRYYLGLLARGIA